MEHRAKAGACSVVGPKLCHDEASDDCFTSPLRWFVRLDAPSIIGRSPARHAAQTLPDWISAHVRMFWLFGRVLRLVVLDNLKSGINKASFYDPEVNLSSGRMASHYGIGIVPARPRRPKDKAKVEAGVRFAQGYILGRVRRQTFFSLAEANQAISGMVARIHDHVMRRWASAGGICSRQSSARSHARGPTGLLSHRR